MGNGDDNICAVCCQKFPAGGTHQNSYGFQKLCASINFEGLHIFRTNDTRNSKRRKRNLSCSEQFPFMCQDCLSSVSGALERKKQLVEMEANVRKLQVKMLRLLKSLQSGVSGYLEDMNKMEALIAESTDNVKNLDKFFHEERNEDDQERGSRTIKDAIQFRNRMITVIDDLRIFKEEVTLLGDGTAVLSSLQQTCNRQEMVVLGDNAFPTTVSEPEGHQSQPQNNVVREQEATVAQLNVMDFEENEETSVVVDRNSSESPEETSDVNYSESDDASSISDAHADEYIPKKKSSCTVKSKKKKMNYQKTLKPPKSPQSSSAVKVNFSGMTRFKKNFVTRALRRLKSCSKNVDNSAFSSNSNADLDNLNPQKTHLLSYDTATASFSLSNIQVTIQKDYLQCSDCNKRFEEGERGNASSRFQVLYRSVQNHIMGHHLKLFICPHCSRTLATFQRFRDHVLGHRNKYSCDICGRPCKSNAILKAHRILHMSEEERAEAREKEGEDGEIHSNDKALQWRRTLEKKYQCSTCGKGFVIPSILKRHEQTHLVERKHMCPNCGKTYESSFDLSIHQKFVCYPGKGEGDAEQFRFQCDHCPKKFAFKFRLYQHKRAVHPQIENGELYQCSMCEKAFKGKLNLTQHEKTHSDERPFLCGNGCGARYKNKPHCRRHEKLCVEKNGFCEMKS